MLYIPGMGIEMITLTVSNVPKEDLKFLRSYAVRAGHSGESDAAIMRYALIELATIKRREREAAA